MQNKGFVRVFALLLALVCIFYLSFSFVTSKYNSAAADYANGDSAKETFYLDSLSNKTVWLGYTLKQCRENEITLGLDLKGGMNVILEMDVADVIRSLSSNNKDENFNKALDLAKARQAASQKGFIDLFVEEYKKLDQGARLSAIFSTMDFKGKITSSSSDNEVIAVIRAELKSAIDNSFNVLRTRIDQFGVVSPNIQKLEQDGRIFVELPGVKDPERVRKLLQGSANLEFWETFDEKDIHQALLSANAIIRDSIAAAQQKENPTTETTATPETADEKTTAATETTTEENKDLLVDGSNADEKQIEENINDEETVETFKKQYPLFFALGISPSQPNEKSPVMGNVRKIDMPLVEKYLSMHQVKEVLPKQLNPKWTVKPISEKEGIYSLIALKVTTRDGRPPLEGDVVTGADAQIDQHSAFSEVNMSMNAEGAKKWARLTKDNIGKAVAIVLDNSVYSHPNVNQEITGGRSVISGRFTNEEAKDLANVLNSGKMSAPARIVNEEMIGPSLGQDAINKGFISFIFALALLMAYLMFVYGVKPGLIANFALLFNLFFTMGVMASFHAVLTLSGIAGVVLALAIAVDANVLIYERIKEEIRGGKIVKKAIEEGYKKAFSAIFDSNLTSIITGIILYVFGTGPIKGFATTLIIGILISFGTAVFMTRVIYETMLSKGKLQNLTFTTSMTENFLRNPKFNLLGNRKMIYTINSIVIVICLVFLGFRGLNQGIDFTGGRNYVIKFENPVNTVEAQQLLDPYFENHTPSVITINTANQIRVSTNFKINENAEGIDEEITKRMFDAFKPLLTEGTSYETFKTDYIQRSQKIGPSIAEDIKTGAFYAVIFAVIAIGLYILLRFRDISYSVGSIVALTGDALFIMGIYAILWGFVPFSLEIDQTFIGAILTVIGYSINDKVVIFDRVREYTHLYPKRPKYELFNEALNSTLDRTFNTSMSTLIVLVIIFVFAGDAIRSFSFAMLLGVFIGTFSSLFTAAPIAYEIQNKKQLKAENKGK